MTASNRAMGLWSARVVVALAAAYLLVGAAGMLAADPSAKRHALEQIDPYLAVLEIIMMLVAPALVVLFAAVHGYAPADRKTHSLVALVFMAIMTGVSCSVHFVLLTAGRQTAYAAIPGPGAFYPWPTVLFAMDLLAWDVFAGLAMLFAAPVFRGGGLAKAIRVSLLVSGGLCLVGVTGPANGDMRFQVLAVAGYAYGLTLICVLLMVFFGRERADAV